MRLFPWGTEFLYPALHANAYRPQDDWVLSPNLPGLQPPVAVVGQTVVVGGTCQVGPCQVPFEA